MMRKSDVIELDMSVDDALKYVDLDGRSAPGMPRPAKPRG